MGIITKIQAQKQMKERYNIYLDDGTGERYAFSVDEHTLVKHGLRKDMEIDELALSEIIYDEEIRKAYLHAVSYLSYQMRTAYEVTEQLRKKEFGEVAMREVISKLKKDGYINDREYAMAYVRTQSNVSKKGPELISRELEAKGVSKDIITISLHEYPVHRQIENAIEWCEKKGKTYRNLSQLQIKKKLDELLIRKGYAPSIIAEATAAITLDDSDDEIVLYQARKYHEKYKKHDKYTYVMKMKQSLYRKGFSMDIIEQAISQLAEEE
ncbi:recombination regulator RecX [Ectobacillus antri]|uniref:Regulatory protein RecX n=1 Tax=Ectobacillus antri TaxID=2486280 RepID=A0ABT6H597_9BACI|nr:recombination regulator RecX [Ectobacillus antri]MDG4657225.1 recombination regulator RecX [Ectobacillus antri]MDG5754423.1 recombination regulator RecX [Ectobacillus antri]